MQSYSAKFARVYNMRWSSFADRIAPKLMDLYEAAPISQINKAVLDLCCGVGHLAVHFLKASYSVTGLDSSKPMLQYAQENARSYIEKGQVKFVLGDASQFFLDERFGLVVSTFDALNHLENEEQLTGCFRSVFSVLLAGGLFVFDLNTSTGLRRWNSISINDENDELLLINRGIYDGQGDKAWTRITGFIRTSDCLYERFDETIFNTVFNLGRARDRLLEAGWRDVYFARMDDLKIPLAEPEGEGHVFVVASK